MPVGPNARDRAHDRICSLIDVATWRLCTKPILTLLYEDLVGTAECDPFDGGCLVVAQALQSVIGGDIAVLVRAGDLADHAAVYANSRLWDWDCPLPPHRFIRRFNRNERASTIGWRMFRDDDLPEAYRDPALARRIADLLRTALPVDPT